MEVEGSGQRTLAGVESTGPNDRVGVLLLASLDDTGAGQASLFDLPPGDRATWEFREDDPAAGWVECEQVQVEAGFPYLVAPAVDRTVWPERNRPSGDVGTDSHPAATDWQAQGCILALAPRSEISFS